MSAAPGSLSAASALNRGGLTKLKARSWASPPIERTSERRRKRQCAMPNRRVRTVLKSNWPNGVSHTRCKWRLQAESDAYQRIPLAHAAGNEGGILPFAGQKGESKRQSQLSGSQTIEFALRHFDDFVAVRYWKPS